MALFGGAYAASTAAKLSFGAIFLSMSMGFFVMPGLLFALCFGYFFGLNMSLRRSMEE